MRGVHWLAYYAIKGAFVADLLMHGPLSSAISALTGLPIE